MFHSASEKRMSSVALVITSRNSRPLQRFVSLLVWKLLVDCEFWSEVRLWEMS